MHQTDKRLTPDAAAQTVSGSEQWHAATCTDVLETFAVDAETGLGSSDVERLSEQYGPNVIPDKSAATWPQILRRQFWDVLVWVLIGAAIVSAAIGEVTDAWTILAIVILNAVLGFVQEWRAEQALQALRQMLSPQCRVIRDGQQTSVEASTLVPGDIVVLETGDRIPADLRLLEATNLNVDESALTGESESVVKQPTAVPDTTVLAEQTSMVWMGTSVTSGRASGIVVATATATQFGRIAGLTASIGSEQTSLQRKLGRLGKQLGAWAIAVSLISIVVGILADREITSMVMTGISLAVAVVPEGLPAVVTITLALGIRTMVRRKALLRRLQAAEALGAATVICTDKTGTLTQNQMTVQKIWLPGEPDGQTIDLTGVGYDPAGHFELDGQVFDYRTSEPLNALLNSGVICNHAQLQHDDSGWHELGEPTEASLVVASYKAWIDPPGDDNVVCEFNFTSDRKRMTVIVEDEDQQVAHVKGAPEVVLELCTTIGLDARPLTDADVKQVGAVISSLADGGMRTLAIARRTLPVGASLTPENTEQQLTLLGIVGILDPPRPEVAAAVQTAHSAGIRLIMITGDAARTALAIGRRIGLNVVRAIEGHQIAAMTDVELLQALDGEAVFARTTPEHKLRIVQLLQSDGHIVGMTGDGVNDAPALKKADIGIAMGDRGTDVAKGASDIVLTDDNFSSIINAIEEGRRQYENIQKFVRYLLASNTGEAVAIVANIMIGGPLILLPVQILWMNLVTDSLIALALGLERPESDLMTRAPVDPKRSILHREATLMILGFGLYVGLMTLALFKFVRGDGVSLDYARTMAFHGIIVVEWFNVLNFRTLRVPVLRLGLFSNGWMLLAIAATLSVQLCALYVPTFQRALHTVPLSLLDWGLIAAVSFPVFLLGETVKWLRR